MHDWPVCVPYKYTEKKVSFSWQEIVFGISNGFLPCYAAVEHAMKEFDKAENISAPLLELVWLGKGEDIHPYVDDLANAEQHQEVSIVEGKWLYLIMSWVFDNRNELADPLQYVEHAYANFDYPECLELFVRYMPSEKANFGSIEKHTARLFDNWAAFLDKQSALYKVC